MKKLAIIFLIGIIMIVGISYMYLNYKASYNEAKKENNQFESYYNQEFYGADVVTLINKAYDNNLTNAVEKDEKGVFKENDTNSIKIDIKIIDNDTTYNMETLYAGGMDRFVENYNGIKFKCTKIEYHKSTGKVKYMLIEQITQ